MIKARLIKRPDMARIIKYVNNGTAVGLTRTAQEGQAASVSAIKGTFTTRGNWFEKQNRYGTKITPANGDKLHAEVKTAADWLKLHEEGGTKTGRGHRLGVPQWKLRPRGSTMKITTPKKARSLLASGKAFILHTPKGDVIATQQGKGANSRLSILYGLESRVRVKKASTFYEPIKKVVEKRLQINVKKGISDAMERLKSRL